MSLLNDAMRRFWAAYQEGLTMSCPVHKATRNAVKSLKKRHEEGRTITSAIQRKAAKRKVAR